MSEPKELSMDRTIDAITDWQGAMGDLYTDRHEPTPAMLEVRRAFWLRILKLLPVNGPESVIEVGANVGLNLRALRSLLPRAKLYAIEPNQKAAYRLINDQVADEVRAMGAEGMAELGTGFIDLAFTMGVLIHIPPERLIVSCRQIHRVAKRWILCAEYFSQKPREIEYRWQTGRLWARDFGSFWLENFPDLKVVDYGFAWKPVTGLDDVTWWLFEKRA